MEVTAAVAPARRKAHEAAAAVGGSRAARAVARGGFASRSVFYVLLAYLAVRVAADPGPGGPQANSHGALAVVSQDWLGKVAIGAAAVGFFVLGAVRLAGAVRDREADVKNRVLTGAQGAFYLALTWVPLSFLLGHHATGSEQSQRRETATLLAWPGGRFALVVVALVLLGVCTHQIRTALNQDFTEGMDLATPPRWVCWIVRTTGTVGIVARALVFVPIAVFLLVVAVQSDPRHSVGLDQELATLARQSWWGPAVLCAVALGLVVFAVYSLLEARYRRVGESD